MGAALHDGHIGAKAKCLDHQVSAVHQQAQMEQRTATMVEWNRPIANLDAALLDAGRARAGRDQQRLGLQALADEIADQPGQSLENDENDN